MVILIYQTNERYIVEMDCIKAYLLQTDKHSTQQEDHQSTQRKGFILAAAADHFQAAFTCLVATEATAKCKEAENMECKQ